MTQNNSFSLFLQSTAHLILFFLILTRESEWTRIQTTAAKKTLLLGQIKMAMHNLYTLVYKHLRKKIPAQEADNTLLQLDKVSRSKLLFALLDKLPPQIKVFIKDLTEITHEIKRHESAAVPNVKLLAVRYD